MDSKEAKAYLNMACEVAAHDLNNTLSELRKEIREILTRTDKSVMLKDIKILSEAIDAVNKSIYDLAIMDLR